MIHAADRKMPPEFVHLATRAVLIGTEILLLGAAVHDVATRTVPNMVPLVILLAGAVLRVLQGGLELGLLAAAIVFLVTAFCWRRGWMGGADVKLATASALVVPPGLVPSLALAISMAGGALILIYLAMRPLVGRPKPGRPVGFVARIWRVERRRIRRLESLPYASAIAAGALFILLTV